MMSDASPQAAEHPVVDVGHRPWTAIQTGERMWVTLVLTLLLILSFVDRNIMKLLVEPLRKDLGITDLQVSLLVGISFSILYSVSCIPMGYAADRVERRKLLSGAVICWSGMSMLCGFAGSYWQLFAGRAGLGIGEAALQPAATSLIRDSYPPERRARAFAIFGIGPLVGTAFAMLIGGYLFSLAEAGLVRDVPVLGALRPWQFALVVPGLAGVVLAGLVLTVREPPRPPLGTAQPTFGALFIHMRSNARLYALVFAAPTLWSLANSGWSSWMAAGLGRTYGLSVGEIGKTAGLIALVLTPIGMISLGVLIDWLTRKGYRDSILQVTIAVQVLNFIPSLLIFNATSVRMMWSMYGLSMLINSSVQIAGSTILTEITPSHLTGKAVALMGMVQNFLGLAIGPTIFALVSAGLFGGESGLVRAMILCYAVVMSLVIGVVVLLLGERRQYRRDTLPLPG